MYGKKLKKAALVGTGLLGGSVAATILGRGAVNRVHDASLKVLMNDLYDENIWELVSAATRLGLQNVVETNLRSSEGKVIERPMGSPKKFPGLEDLLFTISQMYNLPIPLEQTTDSSVTIGKKSEKPFTISMPIMIAPMAYGVALSKKAKIALAKGSAMAGTGTNTGEGPFLPEERQAAKYLIYQFHRGDWGKTPGIMRQCDAIEIQLGQGSISGVGHIFHSKDMDKELRTAFGFPKGRDAVAHSMQPGVSSPKDLKDLVDRLRDVGGGIPIGVKMAAGKFLEKDLEIICNAGVDFIALEGAEAATKASPPILQDDFGVPMIFAIYRAARWLEKNNYKNQVSLIASGKMRTPGDILKACALGADACYIGTIALFAMSHTQVLKALPFEPPTQVVWYHGKYQNKFNIEEGAKYLNQFLRSCKEEINHGIKALGKTSLQDVGLNELMATSEMVSKGCNLPMVYEPYG
ncbi:FMN-binding glutamate synthase family protein [Dethiobacter alkaliphilus]|uniref:Ferredoxin-dependent glutamate synthase n=1 Tax=Dethiobacter alkaliphilus AHT 1 TaxID=555088 RepID=C0GC89_DETAL|nr:FMN-binding glutamate synthase family protein [Dethiobacter alkaliphilus]EEG78824.1 ferredoxin-dependent glutamate synthase [Dethiobacter alkaliphilus AHT 1]